MHQMIKNLVKSERIMLLDGKHRKLRYKIEKGAIFPTVLTQS